MIVQSAQVQFAHQHQKHAAYEKHETLLAQRKAQAEGEPAAQQMLLSYRERLSVSEQSLSLSSTDVNPDEVPELSARGRELAAQLAESRQGATPSTAFFNDIATDEADNINLDAKTLQLKNIVESFTGREIQLNHLKQDPMDVAPDRSDAANADTDPQTNATTTADLIYQYRESYQEQESSLFLASGNITLQSGETLQVNLEQYTQRDFYIENSLEMKLGEVQLTDPLVLNLQGASVTLSEQKYQFDLNGDGGNQAMHFASGQSGFLALDRNGNGSIDDGSELFGALTGNGFAELARYDEDLNGFIDHGDSVFSQLQFLQKNQNGTEQLQHIKELGIGALYLGSESSPFEIKDQDNQLQAKVRSSGFFLYENGSAGSLQQIDLAV